MTRKQDQTAPPENSKEAPWLSCALPFPSAASSSWPGSSGRDCWGKQTIPFMSSQIVRPAAEDHKHSLQHASAIALANETNDVWQLINTPVRGRTTRRRCVSCAETSRKARHCFSSPDRFLSPRAESTERESIFRVSKSPQSLSPRERNTRQRDPGADPFQPTSPSRSTNAVRLQHSSPSGRQQPPHFTPSFIHGHGASPSPVDVDDSPDTPRQISVGAVWNVGGSNIARRGPRAGVPDGRGRLLASGTNGLLHTAHFLDRNSPNKDVQQHEDRLALALDIDQASRVLGSNARPPLMKSASTDSSPCTPFLWRNNSWARDEGADRESACRSAGSPSMLTLPSWSKETQQDFTAYRSNTSF